MVERVLKVRSSMCNMVEICPIQKQFDWIQPGTKQAILQAYFTIEKHKVIPKILKLTPIFGIRYS